MLSLTGLELAFCTIAVIGFTFGYICTWKTGPSSVVLSNPAQVKTNPCVPQPGPEPEPEPEPEQKGCLENKPNDPESDAETEDNLWFLQDDSSFKEPIEPHLLDERRQIALDIFRRYVDDEMPIRLIRLKDMVLVEREDVKRHFHDRVVEKVTEKRIQEKLYWKDSPRVYPDDPRRDAIRSLVLETVQYAILSHRWLAEGEPRYHEMLTEKRPVSPGYDKLTQFCSAARECGIELAWADTCCIDKSSSAELNESICSMFKWYKNAHICIVHLAQTTSLADMPNDPWFKRGWTLQELLAPRNMKFFGAEWVPLTSKHRDIERTGIYISNFDSSPFLTALAKSSGIPESDLLTFSPGSDSVQSQMPWAARRRTTRGEDRAYSLMGIFGVRFPIAYGEGPQRAFCRLIEAILQASYKPGVLNWAGDPANSQVSRALPSSPDCYDCDPSTYAESSFFSKHEILLTSMGLQVDLLFVLIRPITPLCQAELAFHCDRYEIGDLTIRVKPDLQLGCMKDPSFALGIYNYYHMSYRMPNSSQQVEQFQLEQHSLAYLLVSNPFGWTKVSTDEIIPVHVPHCNEHRVLDANYEDLVTMYL